MPNFKYYYYLILTLTFFLFGNEASAYNISLAKSIFAEGEQKVYISAGTEKFPFSDSGEYPRERKEEESELNIEEVVNKKDANKSLDSGSNCNAILYKTPKNLYLQAVFAQTIAATLLQINTTVLGHNQVLYLLFCVFLC